jgi:hypothetical protein
MIPAVWRALRAEVWTFGPARDAGRPGDFACLLEAAANGVRAIEEACRRRPNECWTQPFTVLGATVDPAHGYVDVVIEWQDDHAPLPKDDPESLPESEVPA